MIGTTKASMVAALIILTLMCVFYEVAVLITRILSFPASLGLPIELRAAGVLSIGIGGALTLWLFKYRKPRTMIVSPYFTFSKLFRRNSIKNLSGRVEPLVIKGRQKYVRHPSTLVPFSIFSAGASSRRQLPT
jgi:hypothetical protein